MASNIADVAKTFLSYLKLPANRIYTKKGEIIFDFHTREKRKDCKNLALVEKKIFFSCKKTIFLIEILIFSFPSNQIYIAAVKHGKKEEQNRKTPLRADEDDDEVDALSLSGGSGGGNLMEVIIKDINQLVKYWLGVARDYAVLTLPKQYSSQIPNNTGNFFRLVLN